MYANATTTTYTFSRMYANDDTVELNARHSEDNRKDRDCIAYIPTRNANAICQVLNAATEDEARVIERVLIRMSRIV